MNDKLGSVAISSIKTKKFIKYLLRCKKVSFELSKNTKGIFTFMGKYTIKVIIYT